MPLFAINLPEPIFESIKDLIEQRRYRDVEAFVEVAALNQLALERGTPPAELATAKVPTGSDSVVREAAAGAVRQKSVRNDSRTKKPADGRISRTSFVLEKKSAPDVVPEILQAFSRFGAAEVLTPVDANGGATDHIFGQVNRLFPLKVACRGIANVALANGKSWPEYSVVHDVVGERASKLGSLLEKWDLQHDRKRDEQLATGLPKRGNSASRDRFISQLIARVTRGGDVYAGALCQYQLAAFEGDRVGLTKDGLLFASLANPIFDSADSNVSAALGEDEVAFISELILRCMTTERGDMAIVLREIANGHGTPSELNSAVRVQLPQEWTEGMMLTHISGLVARLADLRLIKRQWDGRFVRYQIGDKARADAFLQS